MAAAQETHVQTGERVADLLDELARAAGPQARDLAEELVRSLVEFYGAGLERAVRLLEEAPAGTDPVRLLAADELVAALLILHDLHPEYTLTRAQRALDEVRPYLGSHAGDVEITALESGEEGRTLRLALRGSCDGCPSSAQTVRWTIEEAIARLAPEIDNVEVEGVAEPEPPALLQIMSHPPGATPANARGGPAGPPPAVTPEGATWHTLAAPAPVRSGESAVRDVAGLPVLLIRTRTGLYAYRDRCPGCGSRLGGGKLLPEDDPARLRCPVCTAEYDVRLAGRGERGHLEPVPLLENDHVVKVALPQLLQEAHR
ncbi:NifU family protein [Streptomyces sp. NPDC006879]|uniref:NifU family protein n=1 Tax=Streptomyces sp. NPDC006879 TaxID=3364767 RepID=UPI0036B11BD4